METEMHCEIFEILMRREILGWIDCIKSTMRSNDIIKL